MYRTLTVAIARAYASRYLMDARARVDRRVEDGQLCRRHFLNGAVDGEPQSLRPGGGRGCRTERGGGRGSQRVSSGRCWSERGGVTRSAPAGRRWGGGGASRAAAGRRAAGSEGTA